MRTSAPTANHLHSTLARPFEELHVEANGEMTLVIGESAVALHISAAAYRRKLEQALRVVAAESSPRRSPTR